VGENIAFMRPTLRERPCPFRTKPPLLLLKYKPGFKGSSRETTVSWIDCPLSLLYLETNQPERLLLMKVESTLFGVVLQTEFCSYIFDPNILCTTAPAITSVQVSYPHHHEMKEVQIRNKIYF
jgi:hypothetical protein